MRWSLGSLKEIIAAGCAILFASISSASAQEKFDAEQLKFFEMKVRPLLISSCLECHSEKKHKGGLQLTSLANALKGGKTGPAFVAGKTADSLLIKAISHDDEDLAMPPDEKLSDADIKTLTEWIAMGAPWPEGTIKAVAPSKQRIITDADKQFWSFQPVKAATPPDVENKDWSKNPIDKFVFAKLKAEGLSPAPEAEKAVLIRRATFDLHGLPPTPEEIDAFVSDSSPDAYDKLVNKLLESPRYGERWGRHWLDLARYAESDGYRQDAFRPNAWTYRDYVIKSFNEDKPYDRFVMEQLAGDEIAPDDPNVYVGTGFLRHGLYEYNQRDVETQWREILNDMTDVTGDVFMGMSMGCARCHDHKFDPILQADYYKLQAFFSAITHPYDSVLATPKEKKEYETALAKWEAKTESIRKQLDEIEEPFKKSATKKSAEMFPPHIQEIWKKPAADRTTLEQQYVELILRQVRFEIERMDGKIKGPTRDKWTALKRQLAEFDDLKPKPLPEAFVANDLRPDAPEATIPKDPHKRSFGPGYLVVLGDEKPKIEIPAVAPQSTGRRLALAKWLTRPDHPLTTRVIANRIWQYHFGRGLVTTSSDYGKLGEKPSHPELLDWLAAEFVKDGWSFKKMHRLIMSSAAYKQASKREIPELAKKKDPENRWLWRTTPRRLDAEQIRDSMLIASGELKTTIGGPSVDGTAPRRSVYTKLLRNTRDPLLEAFDQADGIFSQPNRNITITPTQALMMINGSWPLQRAEALASRLKKAGAKEPSDIVNLAYRIVFGRLPDVTERDAALYFLSRKSPAPPPPPTGTAPAAAPIANASGRPGTQTMPHTGGQALLIRDNSTEDRLRLAASPTLPTEDFTIEAVVLLDSIFPDASVRTIASQWNANQKMTGWSLGITSEKSKHEPLNLILQIIGTEGYEVIPSDLRIELHKTYYIAASVKIKETGEQGITFYMRDLSDPDAPLRVANTKHKVTGGYASQFPFIIGGRDTGGTHSWDGLIEEVKLSNAVLTKEQLMLNAPEHRQGVVGLWKFEEESGIFKDSTGTQKELVRSAPSAKSASKAEGAPVPTTALDATLVDFCHALLNCNEFFYVD